MKVRGQLMVDDTGKRNIKILLRAVTVRVRVGYAVLIAEPLIDLLDQALMGILFGKLRAHANANALNIRDVTHVCRFVGLRVGGQ